MGFVKVGSKYINIDQAIMVDNRDEAIILEFSNGRQIIFKIDSPNSGRGSNDTIKISEKDFLSLKSNFK